MKARNFRKASKYEWRSRVAWWMSFCVFLLSVNCFGQDYNRALYLLHSEGMDSARNYVEEQYDESLYMFGVHMANYSTSSGLDWFTTLYKMTSDNKFLFGKAWAHWLRSEYKKADINCQRILSLKPVKLQTARANFLLGNLALRSSKIDESFKHAKISLKLYEQLGNAGGIYLNSITLAKASLFKQDVSAANVYLQNAVKHQLKAKSYGLGQLLELRSQIAWIKKDVKGALLWAEEAKNTYYEEKKYKQGWFQNSQVSLYLALMGRIDEAKRIAREIDSIVVGLDNDTLKLYNNLTWIYLDKCDAIDSTLRKLQVASMENYKGSSMEQMIKFLENIPCPYVK